jgi:hypothetical protein
MTIEEENARHIAAWSTGWTPIEEILARLSERHTRSLPSLTAAEVRRELAALPRRGLRLITQHFMWHSGQSYGDYGRDRRWYRRQINIGMVEWEPGSSGKPVWRFTLTIEFQLFPDLIWYQHALPQRADRMEYQNSIHGIAGWPFYFSFRDWTCNPAAEGERA